MNSRALCKLEQVANFFSSFKCKRVQYVSFKWCIASVNENGREVDKKGRDKVRDCAFTSE